MDNAESKTPQRGSVLAGAPTLLSVLPPEALPGPHSEYQRKISHFEKYQNVLFLARSALRENYFTGA